MRHVLLAMAESIRTVDREGNEMGKCFGAVSDKQWRNVTLTKYRYNFNLQFKSFRRILTNVY